jgi:DNA modification methylase
MSEFRSKIEDIVETEELNLEQVYAFGKYKQLMPEDAITHPAKFNVELVEFLLMKYTDEGDVVLDPMAGTGILGVIASLHNRHAVQIELEPKYFEWMEKARENVEKLGTLTPKGRIINIRGDCRRLAELLDSKATAVITSPPFLDTNLSGGDTERRRQRLIEAGYDPSLYLGGRARNTVLKHYGEADACITSPPFLDSNPFDKEDPEFWKKGHEMGRRWSPVPPKGRRNKELSQDNISNLPLGPVDAIITSPPYANSKKGKADIEKMAERWDKAFREHAKTWNSWGGTSKTPGRLKAFDALGSGYSENPDNIGNLPLGPIDAVITSPPYGDAVSDDKEGPLAGADIKRYGRWREGTARKHSYTQYLVPVKSDATKSEYADNNIGNLPLGPLDAIDKKAMDLQLLYKSLLTKKGKPTYLSEMLLTYEQIFKTLKPSGVACVVVRPCIRRGQVIDLPYITWMLMRIVGFTLEKAYKIRIDRPSFWRILYAKKYPHVPRIMHDYVVVCRKPGVGTE